jgi:hypothetical protein
MEVLHFDLQIKNQLNQQVMVALAVIDRDMMQRSTFKKWPHHFLNSIKLELTPMFFIKQILIKIHLNLESVWIDEATAQKNSERKILTQRHLLRK